MKLSVVQGIAILFCSAATITVAKAETPPAKKVADPSASDDSKMKQYCLKYPTSVECKPHQVKETLKILEHQREKQDEKALKLDE